MKETIRLPLILGLTTIIAAGALALVSNVTTPKIEAQRAKELRESLAEALPEAAKGVLVPVKNKSGEIEYYIGYAHPDTTGLVGYVVMAHGTGYSSTIETLVGVDTSGVIRGLKILFQQETPGLGAKIQEIRYGESKPWFQVQFINKSYDRLAVDKDGGEIRSVTGATISSRAVTNSVRKAIENLAKKIGGFAHKPRPII